MKSKSATIIVLAALVLFLGWRIVRRAGPGEAGRGPGGARAVPVSLAAARTETVRSSAEFTGSLLPRTQFVVAPKVPGRLERLLLNLGDAVTNGALIAQLDSDEYQQEVEQARAELEVAKANRADTRSALDVARREHERVKELREQQVASAAELDQAEALLNAAEAKDQVAQAQIRQREAALRSADIRLAYTTIAAAWTDGNGPRVVADRFVDEGTMLRANDPVVAVADIGAVIAVVNVIERDFPIVRIGQEATIETDAHPGRSFRGSVVRRAPVLREESRQARVEVEIPNPDRLLAPGMFVRVRIELAEHPDAQVVPTAALVRRNGDVGVFVADLEERKARFVPVKTGLSAGEITEIIEPRLAEPIVVLGQHLLADGAAIIPPDHPSGGGP